MSWMKGSQGGAPPPGPERQPYGAPQPYGNQQNMYNNYQSSPANVQQQQQPQVWQVPQQPPQFNQQYGQAYQQLQGFSNNTNQFYQQHPGQFNQNYSNVPQGYQQTFYPNQVASQHNYTQKKPNSDGWEDNWDWGWDDASKQKSQSQASTAQTIPQTQVYNNANVIEESFATTDTWNWSMEDKSESQEKSSGDTTQSSDVLHSTTECRTNTVLENAIGDNNIGSDVSSQRGASNLSSHQPSDEVRNLSEREVIKEHLPNLALGKRFHIENLTPQWSIESQMSQESSDGPQTHSESTYRSENQSRNSSKSSPGLNTDNSNFNYSQAGYEDLISSQNIDYSRKSEETSAVNSIQDLNKRENHDELINTIQDLSISNHEKPDSGQVVTETNHAEGHEKLSVDFYPRMSRSPANGNTSESHLSTVMLPPQPVSSKTLPSPPLTSTQQPPVNFVPACSSGVVPVLSSNSSPSVGLSSVLQSNNFSGNTTVSGPPSNFSPSSNSPILPPANFPSQNPFKHAGPFSHKNIPKGPVGNTSQPFSPMANNNLSSPTVVNKVSQQSRAPVGFGANLETTPDNSERPDQPHVSAYRAMPVSQQIPDNLEIAPQNDRNEYLQTAHLSGGDYGENTDFSREVPLPSLRRMGVGQQDSDYSQNLNISGDEPPPGLARMVPGQQTEVDHSFMQPNDTYMDRQIDGQPTDTNRRPYRQAEGQQTPDNYSQAATSRGAERRPIGLDRMVPGEPSNDEFLQYQNPNYSNSNDQRVVTGVDHDYTISTETGHSDVREQNVDGSDYSEQTIRNASRDIIGVREANDASPDYSAPLEEQQREVTMEGENLQDLSVISSTDVSYARDSTFGGVNANVADSMKDRHVAEEETVECQANNSTRQSLNGGSSEEDSERNRTFKSSSRKDREKYKSSKDHDQDRDRTRDRDRDKEGRYSRSDRDRRSTRDERRSDKDRRDRDRDRRDRGDSPDSRRYRRRGHRYETEDTDYYSDKERERRRYREGSSYKSSKPPRPEDKERERSRRYTAEREGRDERRRERYAYRDIDTTRKHVKPHRERDDERRRVVTFSGDAKRGSSNAQGESYSSPSRAGSREATVTDEDVPEERRRGGRDERDERRRARSHRPDPYYEGYDSYALQLRQYEYYERLRRADPAAYMRLYKQLMAGHAPLNLYNEGYLQQGYEALGTRGEERGSVHSGRSSANGLKGNDTFGGWRPHAYAHASFALGASSLPTDCSDRELTTDASLNLHLEESTVRSERMTPFKFSTAHIKGRLSARALVCVRAAYPVDGLPATVQLLPLAALLAAEPSAAELHAYPGPLVKGVTHKKSVLDYCEERARGAARGGGGDARGAALLWRLLALLLRQNGVVMGTDIAELLMKNTREDQYKPLAKPTESRRESSQSCSARPDAASSPDAPSLSAVESIPQDEESSAPGGVGEREAVDRLREYLLYGNRQEALEWAISAGLWSHALTLAAHGGRRARAAVAARFQASLPPTDPLHTLYAALAAHQPPAATCVADERWGDWRPHAAILLSNASAKPDQDRRTLTQLGDTLSTRGLVFSAQFCYLAAGVPLAPHPLAPLGAAPAPGTPPPRLSLLLADPRAVTLQQFATNQAIFATEIYEYALSLSQDYVIDELQVYKLVLATRLVEAGLCERALRYAEQAARALARAPHAFPPALPARLALLADRLKYFDPALQEEGEGGEADGGEEGGSEPSPRHQWLADVTQLAQSLSVEASAQTTPQHQPDQQIAYVDQHQQQFQQQQQWGNSSAWADQTLQQYQSPAQQYPEVAEDAADSAPHYYPPPAPPVPPAPPALPVSDEQPAPPPHYDYWQQDALYGYNEQSVANGAEEMVPSITMPGAAPRRPAYGDYDDDRPPSATTDRETDTPQSTDKGAKNEAGEGRGKAAGEARRGGWLGGFLTKLALRPPNQMILPDDKNPTIVWDEERKRWRDTAGDGDDEPAPPPRPPPALPALPTSTPLQSPAAGVPPPSNMYKMQKSRHIKKSYVDILNPGGTVAAAPAPPAALLPAAPAPAPPAYFVPASTVGVYDPTQAAEDEPYRSGI